MIKVVFFASLRETLETSDLLVSHKDELDVSQLIDELAVTNGTHFKEALVQRNILVAINQEMVELSARVKDEDEVAFFPPVTGG